MNTDHVDHAITIQGASMKKLLVTLSITGAMLFGSSSAAFAQTAKTNPVKCVGAAEHKQAQALRLQAAQLDLTAAQARRAAAVAAGLAARVARIDAHIAKITARIATIQANQAKFVARCP
jgi:fructose-1-phosphate kinase PfkB-like protein